MLHSDSNKENVEFFICKGQREGWNRQNKNVRKSHDHSKENYVYFYCKNLDQHVKLFYNTLYIIIIIR